MTTKTITLRAIDLLPGLGNDRNGIPFRQLVSLVEKVRAQVPDDEEATCMAMGAEGLTFPYQHKLTPTEALQDELDAERALTKAVRGLRNRDGTLVADIDERLRALGI